MGKSRGATAGGGGAVLFRLNYTVTQGGQSRNFDEQKKKEEDTYCTEGLA